MEFGCTPDKALGLDPALVFPVIEARRVMQAKELLEVDATMLQKHPQLVKLWKEAAKSLESESDDGNS